MPPATSLLTSASLLKAVSSGHSPLDWERFLAKYAALLRSWAIRWGAKQELADDMVQETLLNVLRTIPEFQYNPAGSFRSWLKVVAWRSWRHIERREHLHLRLSAGQHLTNIPVHNTLFNSAACRDDLLELFQKMAREEIFEMACAQVRPRFSPTTWQAFELMEIQQCPGDETAARLGLSIPAVHAAVYRVRKQLTRAVRHLDGL